MLVTLSITLKSALSQGLAIKPHPNSTTTTTNKVHYPIAVTFYSEDKYSYTPYISKFGLNSAQISTKTYTPPPSTTTFSNVQNTPQFGSNLAYSGCGTNYYQNWIYEEESGCSTTEYNSIGCLGLGQACPGSKLLAVCPTESYTCENQYFTNYMLSRYGSWENAYNFHQANGWW
jgi:hypothetical protein